MSEHTPAPWRAEEEETFRTYPRVYAERRLICTVGNAEDERWQQWNADARLIAAAPELLEALKEAERYLEYFSGETNGTFIGSGTPRKGLAQARAAIAKAEGR